MQGQRSPSFFVRRHRVAMITTLITLMAKAQISLLSHGHLLSRSSLGLTASLNGAFNTSAIPVLTLHDIGRSVRSVQTLSCRCSIGFRSKGNSSKYYRPRAMHLMLLKDPTRDRIAAYYAAFKRRRRRQVIHKSHRSTEAKELA